MNIPNPTRKVTINFTIEQVKQALKKFSLLKKKYNMFEEHDTMNFYVLDALEFLSFGVYIDVNLNEISETKTEISIEVRRKIGCFDKTQEIQVAGTHINNLLEGLGQLLEKPELGAQLEKAKVEKEAQLEIEKKKTPVGLLVFAGLAVMFLIMVVALVASV